MGSFGTAFLQTTADAANKKFAEKTAEENKVKDEQRKMYWGIAYDTTGQYNDAQKSAALEQYDKLVPPSLRKPSQKFNQIFGTLSKAAQAHAAQSNQSPQGQPPTPALSPSAGLPTGPSTPAPGATAGNLPGGPTVANAAKPQQTEPATPKPGAQPSPAAGLPTGPKTPAPLPQQAKTPQQSGGVPIQTDADMQARADAMAAAEEKRKLAATEENYNFWLKKGKEVLGKDANPRDLAEYAGSNGTKLPPVGAVSMKPVQLDMKDGATVPAMISKDGKYYDLEGGVIEGGKIKGEAKKEPTAMPRFDTHFVTIEQAKQQQKNLGTKFTGVDGNEISLEDVPAGMVLQPVTAGSKFLFMPVTEEFAKIVADNQVKVIGKQHEDQAANGGGVVVGAARVPTIKETSPEGIGGSKSVSSPVTGGAIPKPPQSGPAPSPKPQATPARNQASPATPAPSQGGADAGDPILPGISTAQYRAAASQAAPVAAAVTEIFGDPRQPDLHPLQSYAKLADNKQSQERIGNAIQLTINGFGDGIKEAAIGAGAAGIHVSAGGWGTWLDNQLNGPQAGASAQAKTLRGVIDKMTPEERDAYDSTMATMSTMAGLRSISRQSAAIGSLQLIERELPKIGINTTSSRQFYDQLQRTAGAIATFANTPGLFPRIKSNGQVIRAGFTPEMQKRITELTGEMEKAKAKSGASPNAQKAMGSGPGTARPGAQPKTADEYLKQLGQ